MHRKIPPASPEGLPLPSDTDPRARRRQTRRRRRAEGFQKF
ncbi:MAG: hypothetical protein ACFB22_13390 [Rhodothalassiaceae bacterium]